MIEDVPGESCSIVNTFAQFVVQVGAGRGGDDLHSTFLGLALMSLCNCDGESGSMVAVSRQVARDVAPGKPSNIDQTFRW